jgi:hypothetical protein
MACTHCNISQPAVSAVLDRLASLNERVAFHTLAYGLGSDALAQILGA